jgi:CRP-like cAMP-binding protein
MEIYIPELLKGLLPPDLLEQCQTLTIEKGQYLFHQGHKPQWMFFIVNGEAILSRTNARGETVILQRCKNGFVSEASLFTDVYHCDAIASQIAQSITLPISSFRKALDDPAFALRWVQLLSKEIMRLRTVSERLTLKDIPSKLIHLIKTEGKDGVLHIQTDLKSIALEIGVTHEALYRAIAAMENNGSLKKKSNYLELLVKSE